MLFRASLVLAAASMLTTVSAVVPCAVCPASIFYGGLTRTLTLAFESSVVGYIQCNYDTPAISGFNPYCVYTNLNGALYGSNTNGACPTTATLTTETSGPCTVPT
ncbi:hypothetical protein H0H93_001997 [Arthromyces matolae]|nr:hypothetical protein H0H93_001997 [Arthromyces matolae]